MRSSYGLAEATVYVVTSRAAVPDRGAFRLEKLWAAGHAELCAAGGSELVGCGTPRSCDVRVVDPDPARTPGR